MLKVQKRQHLGTYLLGSCRWSPYPRFTKSKFVFFTIFYKIPLEICMHLKFENYWFIGQMCEDVTILQIVLKLKKSRNTVTGITKSKLPRAKQQCSILVYSILKTLRELYILGHWSFKNDPIYSQGEKIVKSIMLLLPFLDVHVAPSYQNNEKNVHGSDLGIQRPQASPNPACNCPCAPQEIPGLALCTNSLALPPQTTDPLALKISHVTCLSSNNLKPPSHILSFFQPTFIFSLKMMF